MATDDKKTPDPRLEVSVAKPSQSTFEAGEVSSQSNAATTVDLARDGTVDVRTGLPDAGDVEDEEKGDGLGGAEEEGSDGEASGDPEEDSEGAGEGPEPLPEYDPENAEVRAKYDERYFQDGTLNQQALGDEFWANYAKADNKTPDGHLSEGTYKYLEDTLGVSKDFINQVERGLVADRTKREEDFFTAVGGKDKYEAAIKWAREGGYTSDQRKRFNDLSKKGGDDFVDAVEALMARHGKATGGDAPAGGRRGPPGRRRSTPQRDASGTAGATGSAQGDTFKTHTEYSKAWGEALDKQKEARASGDRDAVKKATDHVEALRKKARRSKFVS